MVEGTGLSLYMLIGAIMFGLFAGATAIFGEEVGAFVGGLVETVKDSEHNEANEDGGILEEEDDPNCVLATDEDFSGTTNGSFRYIGSEDCVKIPHVIKGVEVTSYQFMFMETSVSKVISDNPNVTDMLGMFALSQSTELDISSIDTSNVTDMSYMFAYSRSTAIDLSSFDTSNVTDMSYMFADIPATEIKGLENFNTSKVTNMTMMFSNSKATALDLSNFNTSNVTDMSYMFESSQATEIKGLENFDTSKVTNMSGMFTHSQAKTVYARTQADADKFNTSFNKPIGLQVIVKQ